jgi:isopentenyl-diphosphate Delta-isomerase
MSDIRKRKSEHLDIVLDGLAAGKPGSNGLDAIRFQHNALPELHLDHVDVSTTFLGRRLRAPYLISSMTGGPARAEGINSAIAEAAGALGIAFGVGSQRVALEAAGSSGFDRGLRQKAGPVPILANFGAAQLKTWDGIVMAERAVDMIDADALIIHLNPLQEAVQEGGDRDWSGLLSRIEVIVKRLDKPVVIKEVGNGISGSTARRLVDAGVAVIDVAGAGGTSWAAVEGARAPDPAQKAIAMAFQEWGISTADAIVDVRRTCPTTPIIASGGIRDGVDAAKAIRLGADIVGQAAGVLAAAIAGPDAIIAHVNVLVAQLRIACFCTGSADLKALRTAPLL